MLATGVTVMQGSLLRDTCVGCHSSTTPNDGTTMPYVYNTSGPNYGTTGTESGVANTLAGGDFYWVAFAGGNSDRKGHNVSGISGLDAPLGTIPPGGVDLASLLTCAGATGCHGDNSQPNQVLAIAGGHHAADNPIKTGGTFLESYRFLNGIAGYEDSDYEFQPTATEHNQYKGFSRSADNDPDTTTISHFCATCHGNFHNGGAPNGVSAGSFSSPWIRHPVDIDMVDTGEYSGYVDYSVISPVASNPSDSVLSTGLAVNQEIVMCISCHRAHGTPNDAILRWDYTGWPAAGYNGCAVCHSSKN